MDKYIYVTLLVKIPEEDYKNWDEDSDSSSYLFFLHRPDEDVYLIDHTYLVELTPEEFSKKKTKTFTEEGGI